MKDMSYSEYKKLIFDYAKSNYIKMFRQPSGNLRYKYIVPGSVYDDCLWDWDSWLTNIALRKIAADNELKEYEKGCILNFIENMYPTGAMPIFITHNSKYPDIKDCETQNIHKPCLAQHALFICSQNKDFKWLEPYFDKIETFVGFYINNCRHESGLYFWLNDNAIGVDNDPCTFYRPDRSSASVYLNCMMYKELQAVSELAAVFGYDDKKCLYENMAKELCHAVREHMWDERNGFYYNVDINLLPINSESALHSGCPRHWNNIIQKIDVWSGFMAMWAGIATKEQAERMVAENYKNEKTFNSPYGVRTLSKLEKMYRIIKSDNPSCWLGPIWGISNYMTFVGLCNYGFNAEARELAGKTVRLLGEDLKRCGEFHEYYHPDTGEGINNPGFQNWNLLVVDMMEYLDNGDL